MPFRIWQNNSHFSKKSYLFAKHLNMLVHDMLHQGPIGDLNMLHRRPTCLIEDPLETDMPDGRPTGDLHA